MSATSTLVADPPAHMAFPDNSTLDLLIPDNLDFDLESLLNNESQLESRRHLFFEELLPVYVVLRSSLPSFQDLLRDIEITVTAHATPAAPPPRLQQNGQSAPPEKPLKLTLDSITVTNSDPPISSGTSGEKQTSHAVWKTNLYLRYPIQKLHRPSVHLTVSAVSKASGAAIPIKEDSQDEYLTSAAPTSENLLQSLQHVVHSTEGLPYLPSSRIQKVAPRASPALLDARPLRTSSRLFPVFSALAAIVHVTPDNLPDMLLCLDLESSRYVDYNGIQLNEIKAEGDSILVEPLSADMVALKSPVTLHTGDRSTFLYKLVQEYDSARRPTKPSSIRFEIRAEAQVSATCRVQLRAQWRGNVQFPHFQPQMRMPRNSLRPQSVASTMAPQDFLPSRPLSKRMSYTGRPMSSMTTTESGGVMFAFTGPESVIEGETFYLDVFVVNRSSRRKRLAIVAIPRSARMASSTTGAHQNLRLSSLIRQESADVAEAVLDDRTIYNLQDQKETRVSEVVCLNADVRVGPLPPGACHNVQLEFLTLSAGLVGLAAVQVVDVETRETTHITELPDIMVSKAADSNV